jgi:hypothetical protein
VTNAASVSPRADDDPDFARLLAAAITMGLFRPDTLLVPRRDAGEPPIGMLEEAIGRSSDPS